MRASVSIPGDQPESLASQPGQRFRIHQTAIGIIKIFDRTYNRLVSPNFLRHVRYYRPIRSTDENLPDVDQAMLTMKYIHANIYICYIRIRTRNVANATYNEDVYYNIIITRTRYRLFFSETNVFMPL